MNLRCFVPFLATAVLAAGEDSYWAYQKPVEEPVPEIEDSFVANPIDAFILEGLREKKITPNPSAESHQLIRRVFYDVTGLPPTRADLEKEQSWDKLVDQLLASPRFGEKMATHWLDLVRYAETNGFERDSEKEEMWRYRDYVIKSFNENKRYDRFLLEQLAGDQVPDKSLDSSVATGFLALMQRDDEPADKPQAHADQVSDIVDVAGEAFLGTTMNCTKCHDHKGDPITQADYFSMMAFFDGIEPYHFKQPTHTWIDPEVEKKHRAQQHAKNLEIEALWKTVSREKLTPFLKRSPKPRELFENGWKTNNRVPVNPAWSLPSFDASKFKDFTGLKHDKPIAIRREFGLQEIPERFLIYLKTEAAELKMFINGTLVHEGVPEVVHGERLIPLDRKGLEQLTTGRNVMGIIARAPDQNRRHLLSKVTRDPVHDMDVSHFASIYPNLLVDLFGEPFANEMSRLVAEKRELDRPLNGIRYMSIRERHDPPPPHIHIRGSVHAQGDPVRLGFPAVMGGEAPAAESPRRLAYARWVTSKDNPLTARVMANRLWQYLFGKGLVESSNDFGSLGTGVTNQKLLDWLALEFMRSDWNVKHLMKLMLTSSTYRMSSAHQQEAFRIDPTNSLHWQHAPRRLTAEEIWDSYLIVARKLENQLGGPPVRPKMPDAVLATSSRPNAVWRPTRGKAANRRAVYIHVKRSIKLPLLAAFDSPERDLSCPSRYATTVPTQALTMLNSEFMNDLAEEFSNRLPNAELKAQLQEAFRIATCRALSEEEIQNLLTLAADLKSTHQLSEKDLRQRLCLLILNLNETLYLD
ncbi:MAG: DUF1549 and DUF1553 domain-containing protein [Akkermansiaceae bacterium]